MGRAVLVAGTFLAPAPMRRSRNDFEATPALFFVCRVDGCYGDT